MQMLHFFKIVVMLTCFFITAYCFYEMVGAFVTVKQKNWIKVIVFCIQLVIPNTIIFNKDFVNISWAFTAFLLTVFLGYEGPASRKLSTVFILYPMVVSFSYIRDYLSHIRWEFHNNEFIHLMIYIVSCLATSAFWYIIYRTLHKKIISSSGYLTHQMWILLDVISLLPLFAVFYIIVTAPEGYAQFASLPVIIIGLFSSLGILFLVFDMARHARMEAENENFRLQAEYYKELEHNQQEIRRLRHDINNHLSVISTCLNQNHIEEAKEYFRKLSDIAAGTNRVFCNNTLVNAVLNAKYNQALEASIDVFFHIDLSPTLGIDDIDLCCLFANTLDNAIEACASISNPDLRKIEVRARCKKGFLSLQITNTYDHELSSSNGVYLTTKKDNLSHGFGIQKIKDIVNKYHGTMEISHAAKQFCVTIIMGTV